MQQGQTQAQVQEQAQEFLTSGPEDAELQEQEYWGEEVESYFARWAETGEALMAQESSRIKPVS